MKLTSIVTLIIIHYLGLNFANGYSKEGNRAKLLSTNNIRETNEFFESPSNRLSPVILLPGDGGSRLQAKLDRIGVSHRYCERKSNDWFDLWLNLSLLVPFALDCWVDK